MLSKEYKENVMKRLKNMDAKELVNLLEEVGSTRNDKAPFRRGAFSSMRSTVLSGVIFLDERSKINGSIVHKFVKCGKLKRTAVQSAHYIER